MEKSIEGVTLIIKSHNKFESMCNFGVHKHTDLDTAFTVATSVYPLIEVIIRREIPLCTRERVHDLLRQYTMWNKKRVVLTKEII